jgi:hypothetical protein
MFVPKFVHQLYGIWYQACVLIYPFEVFFSISVFVVVIYVCIYPFVVFSVFVVVVYVCIYPFVVFSFSVFVVVVYVCIYPLVVFFFFCLCCCNLRVYISFRSFFSFSVFDVVVYIRVYLSFRSFFSLSVFVYLLQLFTTLFSHCLLYPDCLQFRAAVNM